MCPWSGAVGGIPRGDLLIFSMYYKAFEFDLLVPPYDHVKLATAEQMREKIIHSKMTTGKRLGFAFNADDV